MTASDARGPPSTVHGHRRPPLTAYASTSGERSIKNRSVAHPDVARFAIIPYYGNLTMLTTSTRSPAVVKVVWVAAALTLAGCGVSRSEAPSPFEGGNEGGSSVEDPIRVEVQNLNFNDVTVWAVRQGGQRIRIGRVTGKTDETFRIPWNLALPIHFLIDVTGGRSCRTQQISVERDSRVWVAVPSSVGAQPCRIGRG